jgi:outer membrane protein TolC
MSLKEFWNRMASFFPLFARIVFVSAGLLGFALKIAAATNDAPVVDLKLGDYLQQVVQRNESLQAQMLEAEVNRRKHKAEAGIFEPQLTASVTREANSRTNDVQQQAAQNGQGFFSEQNTIYDGGLESLLPTGGKIRLGYTLSDLDNNINPYGNFITSTNQIYNKQYQTFVGVTFDQPLLKDGGFTPTLARLRLSALDSDIAFQEYRQQLMLTIFRAESAYWNLYFSQEQVRFFDQSVSVAKNVLADSREKLKTGQGAELDVMEAQSALALRYTKRNDALQNYYDALGGLQLLMGGPAAARHYYYDALGRPQVFVGTAPPDHPAGPDGPVFHVVDQPRETSPAISYEGSLDQAYSLNPDYLIQQEKLDQERVRLGVAKNGLLPDLNLKTAYGYNGLGLNPNSSWDMAQQQMFPSWLVSLELDIPLGGNIKGRNLYQASKLSLDEAAIRLKGVQTEIASGITTAIQKANAWEQSIQSYQMVVHYNEELLKTQLERFKAGRVDGHAVLEVESDLLDARQELASALTQYQRALLQVELTDGAILKDHNLDLTRGELKHQTDLWLHGENVPPGDDASAN